MSSDISASRYLANNIKELRGTRQLTQIQLSKKAGIPRTTLTNFESGSGNPTLVNLSRLGNALDVSIEELLAKPRSGCKLIRAKDHKILTKANGQVKIRKLLPESIPGMAIDHVDIAPGSIQRGIPHLEGTKEYITVLSGKGEVAVAGEIFFLEKGDVLAFPGNSPHSYKQAGKGTFEYISFVTFLRG